MASSSTTPRMKYDVFLSFRGEDTRDNFTSHLYTELCRKKIETFIDYELKRGDEISPSLLNAIEESRIAIVIFSKGYAYSRWCLEELAKILECKNMFGQIVVPIFYNIDPSDVRNQIGTFAEAFAMLEERFKDKVEKLKTWRTSLTEAANLSGWDSRLIRPDSSFVEEIVKDILKRLNNISPRDGKDLVGMESRMGIIESLLFTGSKDVCVVGIWGIGGIGKTTLASAVFNKIFNQFEGSCFIHNVREESGKSGGLTRLRQELISALLEDGISNKGMNNMGVNFLEERLRRKKVLIVLDDVTQLEQINSLMGGADLKNCFGLGSRIIITSRDKQILNNCRVDQIVEVLGLYHHEAIQLFSRYAFDKNYITSNYAEILDKVVRSTKGVPLALKVLGSHFYGKNKKDWEKLLKKLGKIPQLEIKNVLKISYDRLDDEEQNIFLDLACFFKGENRDFVTNILDGSGFSSELGISVLIDKSLISVSNNKIQMHDLLQEMGREIVRQESTTNSGKCSRLWHHKDICEILTSKTGSKTIEGISLDMSQIKDIYLNPHAFAKMHRLRFLIFYSSSYEEKENKVHGLESLESEFRNLRYLRWHGYPFRSLLSSFHLKNLVALCMPQSNIEQLWNGVQGLNKLEKLKYINLSHSKLLTKSPNLLLTPNLESLILEGCTSLLEIHSSVRNLNELIMFDLRDCNSLRRLPSCSNLKSLRSLILSGCSKLNEFPDVPSHLEELLLNGTAIEDIPASIECLSRLVVLDLENCSRLESLSSSIYKLKSLEYLNVSGCSKLQSLPKELDKLEALKELKASGIRKREIPSTSSSNPQSQEMVGFPLFSLKGFRNLTNLHLNDCGITELPGDLGQMSSLKSLYLRRNSFRTIPASIKELNNLYWLSISNCESLQSIPELPRDLELEAHNCTSLQKLSGLSTLYSPYPWMRQAISFVNCFQLDNNALSHIAQYAMLKLSLMASALLKGFSQAQGHDVLPNACICVPGSEISYWFDRKSVGSRITLDLKPGCLSKNFVGFAVAAVVEFREHYDDGRGLMIGIECQLRSPDGVSYITKGSLIGWDSFQAPRCVGSDHVFMGYDFNIFPRIGQDYYNITEVYIQFYLHDSHTQRIECCNVKKCGVHMLYAEYKNGTNEISIS